jgi:hypothetical protein
VEVVDFLPALKDGAPAVPLKRHLGGFLLRCRLPPLLAG